MAGCWAQNRSQNEEKNPPPKPYLPLQTRTRHLEEEVLGIQNGLRMERPRSPCEERENPRQIGRAQGEVRKPKCQRKED